VRGLKNTSQFGYKKVCVILNDLSSWFYFLNIYDVAEREVLTLAYFEVLEL
jgi:hypothetical protein